MFSARDDVLRRKRKNFGGLKHSRYRAIFNELAILNEVNDPMKSIDAKDKRPLSPHLQIYRPIPTMVMSIMHRITGAALYVGTLLLAWWLIALSSGEPYFNFVNGFFGSFLGLLILFGYTWALIHHALGGIRHFIWDLGHGFEPKFATRMAYATAIGSVSLTGLLWIIGFAAA